MDSTDMASLGGERVGEEGGVGRVRVLSALGEVVVEVEEATTVLGLKTTLAQGLGTRPEVGVIRVVRSGPEMGGLC